MATISTYSELGTALAKWTGGAVASADTDELIDLFEAYVNTKLRCRQMEKTSDLTPTSNVCTLPTDYLEYKRVVEKASIRRRLDYITEDAADVLYPTRYSSLSCHFIIVGSSLTALPLSANTIELTYYQKVPALSDANTTNWLLTAHPGLYLAGCKMYAGDLNGDDGMLAKQATIVNQFIDGIHALDNRAKFGNAGITLRGHVP